MTLDNLMNMARADRYTEDGRQQIQDARKTYKPGDISTATGLQKQPDGSWAPPKKELKEEQKSSTEPKTQPGEHGDRPQTVYVRKDSISPKGLEDELSRNFYNAKHEEDLESDLASLGYSLEEMNSEYAVASNNKGSQFQIKFSSHGDGRDFTIESIHLVYQDEDDDTDYDTDDAAPPRMTADTKIRVKK